MFNNAVPVPEIVWLVDGCLKRFFMGSFKDHCHIHGPSVMTLQTCFPYVFMFIIVSKRFLNIKRRRLLEPFLRIVKHRLSLHVFTAIVFPTQIFCPGCHNPPTGVEIRKYSAHYNILITCLSSLYKLYKQPPPSPRVAELGGLTQQYWGCEISVLS